MILVFLFATGQVQFSAFGPEAVDVKTFPDNEQNKPAFVELLGEYTTKSNAKVCAVVPSYDYESTLHKPLYDLLTGKGDDLPGIWEQQEGVKKIFRLSPGAKVSIEDSVRFCKLAAPIAFKNYGK